jgi:phospholipid/cholesterol/gamma-HCH transport system substrate-binding protein
VELAVSPLGNHFYFYPGRGERQLEEEEFVPAVNSPEGLVLQRRGLTDILVQDDSITLLISRANTVLGDLDQTVIGVRDALAGTDETSLGRIVQGAEKTVEEVPKAVDETLTALRRDIEPVLKDLRTITEKSSDPDSLLMAAMDADGFVYTNLESSLQSLSETLQNLDRASAMLPSELSQVAGLLAELRATLKTADDVLVALSNNPLLRKGIPAPVNTQSSGTNPRDVSF